MKVIVSEKLKKMYLNTFSMDEKKIPRIVLIGITWCGPGYGIVLDKQREDDILLKDETGFCVLINQNIMNEKGFLLDYYDIIWSKRGFRVYDIN